MLKTNVKTKTAIKEVAEVLNRCTFLFDFDVEERLEEYTLKVSTDKGSAEYKVKGKSKMVSFLQELKPRSMYNEDDIEDLIEELTV